MQADSNVRLLLYLHCADIRTCLHKRIHVSFRQILLHTA